MRSFQIAMATDRAGSMFRVSFPCYNSAHSALVIHRPHKALRGVTPTAGNVEPSKQRGAGFAVSHRLSGRRLCLPFDTLREARAFCAKLVELDAPFSVLNGKGKAPTPEIFKRCGDAVREARDFVQDAERARARAPRAARRGKPEPGREYRLTGDASTPSIARGDTWEASAVPRALSTIARDISRSWRNVNYAARPYLAALLELEGIGDAYYQDTARDIVARFLCNASSWRGPDARRIKLELRGLLNASDPERAIKTSSGAPVRIERSR